MLNCQSVTKLLSEAQERKLSLSEKMSLKMHLMMCSGCHNFGQQMHQIRGFAKAYAKGADQQKLSNIEDKTSETDH